MSSLVYPKNSTALELRSPFKPTLPLGCRRNVDTIVGNVDSPQLIATNRDGGYVTSPSHHERKQPLDSVVNRTITDWSLSKWIPRHLYCADLRECTVPDQTPANPQGCQTIRMPSWLGIDMHHIQSSHWTVLRVPHYPNAEMLSIKTSACTHKIEWQAFRQRSSFGDRHWWTHVPSRRFKEISHNSRREAPITIPPHKGGCSRKRMV